MPLHLVVPAATIVLAAGALLTFAAPRTVLGVRLHGGATTPLGRQTVRVSCLRSETGVVDGVPLDGLVITVDGETQTAACDAAGIAEVDVELRASDRERPREGHLVRIVRGDTLLAAGTVDVSPDVVRAASVVRRPLLQRTTSRGMKATAALPGGALTLGSRSTVFVRVAPTEARFEGYACPPKESGGSAVPGASWTFEGQGAELRGEPRCGPFGWELSVEPSFVTASMSIAAKAAPTELLWEAQVPVVATPIVEQLMVKQLDDGQRAITAMLRSAAGAKRLHVRVDDGEQRRIARWIDLQPSPAGPTFAPLHLVLAGAVAKTNETDEILIVGTDDGVAASSWAQRLPIAGVAAEPTRDLVLVPPVRWLDGLAPLAARETARTTRARGAVAIFVLVGAVLEIVLVVRRARASTRAFRAHLAATATEGAEELPSLEDTSRLSGALVAVLLIAIGFATLGLIVASRTG